MVATTFFALACATAAARSPESPSAVPATTAASAEIAAQPARIGRVTGTVLLPDSSPLAGALVRLAGTARAATTSGNGRFTFDSLPPGQYVLEVQSIGFAVTRGVIAVNPAEPTVVTIGGSAAQLTLQPAVAAVSVFVIPAIRWAGATCSTGTAPRSCPILATKTPYTVDGALTVWAPAEPLAIVQVCNDRISRVTHVDPIIPGPNVISVRCA
jgi:hypothetical protein